MSTRKRETAPTTSPDAGTIVRALREAYEGPAWHGPAVRTALRGVSAEQAAVRPASGRNTIWDLVLHMAYARHRLLHRVKGFHRLTLPSFPRKLSKSWFPELPGTLDEASWRRDQELLQAYQERFVDTVAELPEKTLRQRRRSSPRSLGSELLGLAFHDAYHAGQIRLLVRLDEA
jgi:uncharacterized damage-inducible protein DinB